LNGFELFVSIIGFPVCQQSVAIVGCDYLGFDIGLICHGFGPSLVLSFVILLTSLLNMNNRTEQM